VVVAGSLKKKSYGGKKGLYGVLKVGENCIGGSKIPSPTGIALLVVYTGKNHEKFLTKIFSFGENCGQFSVFFFKFSYDLCQWVELVGRFWLCIRSTSSFVASLVLLCLIMQFSPAARRVMAVICH